MQTPDWCQIIEQLEQAGESRRTISDSMQIGLTDRMIRAYKMGAQPAYFRAVGLIELWRVRFGKRALPMADLIRGHRAGRTDIDRGPKLQSLPAWPVAAPVAVRPVKRRKVRG